MRSTVIVLTACLGVSSVFLLSNSQSADPKREADEVVGITLRTNVQEVTVGEFVRLEELVPASSKLKPQSVSHRVLRIGHYDKKLEALVNLETKQFCEENPDEVFSGLPSAQESEHGMRFNVINPRVKGIEFEFRPKRLGIFLVKAAWITDVIVKDETVTRIRSQPVVIVVKPPLDKEGRPVIKPEWLER
jgi:hypothetical protein